MPSAKSLASPTKRASAKRRKELRRLLMVIAQRTTQTGTFTALAKKLQCNNTRVCAWINCGQIPPWRAVQMLTLRSIDSPTKTAADGDPQIFLKDLTPDLHSVE